MKRNVTLRVGRLPLLCDGDFRQDQIFRFRGILSLCAAEGDSLSTFPSRAPRLPVFSVLTLLW